MRLLFHGVALGALALQAAACGPKAPGGGAVPSPSPTPVVRWEAHARLVDHALGGPRRFWNDPPIRPGERIRWLITSEAFPERFLEVRRSGEPGASTWTILAGHPDRVARTLTLAESEGRIAQASLEEGPTRARTETPGDIAALAPALVLGTSGEEAFTAAGGSFLGNEVLRVPAGEFRARHAVVQRDGRNWHLWLVRLVPGGIAKVEVIPEGAMEPTLIMELDDYTRLPRSAAGGP